MIRQFLSLLFAAALFGMTAQSAAFASGIACPDMQVSQGAKAMADCARMMDGSTVEKAKPAQHKNCTPADCLSMALACGTLVAMPAFDPDSAPTLSEGQLLRLAGLQIPLRGRSPPPDIQPPIA